MVRLEKKLKSSNLDSSKMVGHKVQKGGGKGSGRLTDVIKNSVDNNWKVYLKTL